MKLINTIQVEYYRSLKKVTIKNINHLNIFSGKNDIGKSNVLHALDTFFNKSSISFADDYNKERLEEVRKDSIRGKQYFKITIEFNNPGTYKTLPSKFTVSKSWDRLGNLIEAKDNFESLQKANKFIPQKIEIARRSLTQFVNKIRYTYIPAIRDERFFSYLLNMLQEAIFEAEEKRKNQTFTENISNFNQTISDLTEALNKQFEQVSGISSSLSFPNSVAEIFQRLIIDTKVGDHEIPLRLRGDGVRLRYIPTILNYISENSRGYQIWGFDEPENSCEYSLTQQIAEQFKSSYAQRNQIFVASHSFHFISIEAENTSRYRVYKDDGSINTNIIQLDDSNKNVLSEELGILDINRELAKLYQTLTEEMDQINDTKKALQETQKPYIIFEGKTDNKLFEIAFEELFNKKISTEYTLCGHLTNESGAAIGSSATSINQFLYNHIAKIPTNNYVIAIFDADQTGINELKSLKTFEKIDISSDQFYLSRHKTNRNVYAMTLVIPLHRSEFFSKSHGAEYCHVSTELLLNDTDIHPSNRHYPTLYDQTVYGFSGKKDNFANKISSNKSTTDFNGFRPTFDLIKEIVDGHR